MANLAILFKQAAKQLPHTGLSRSETQEILEWQDIRGRRIQGIAWRPLSDQQTLQFYPSTRGKQAFREGSFLVIKGSKSECNDPNHQLNPAQWSYVGCNCSNLSDEVVLGWVSQAYEYLKRDKGGN